MRVPVEIETELGRILLQCAQGQFINCQWFQFHTSRLHRFLPEGVTLHLMPIDGYAVRVALRGPELKKSHKLELWPSSTPEAAQIGAQEALGVLLD